MTQLLTFSTEMDLGRGDGERTLSIPSGYTYMAAINNTGNTIEVFQDTTTRANKSAARHLIDVPIYTSITVPLFPTTNFTFIWTDGGDAPTKKLKLIFSNQNPQMNGLLGSPLDGGSVEIRQDSVGLAKASQLPTTLSQTGALKVSVVEGFTSVDLAQKAQLPAALGSSGGMKVELIAGSITAAPDVSATWGCDDYTPSTTGEALGAVVCKEVALMADPDNTAPLLIGPSGAKALFPLMPGSMISLTVADRSMVYAKSSAGTQKLHTLWRG